MDFSGDLEEPDLEATHEGAAEQTLLQPCGRGDVKDFFRHLQSVLPTCWTGDWDSLTCIASRGAQQILFKEKNYSCNK